MPGVALRRLHLPVNRFQAMNWTKLRGMAVAKYFARTDRFILAIKHLECANPEISRQVAMAAVASFGYELRLPSSTHEVLRLRVL